eukprot:CAMPEP_0172516064 /NCGR_PEP_ID=MMETSP1066-20121228/273023_1 /TAXON_ID=671091 /ORGANISM="Coscinodiscus wailesii, Strain CCMP2513" /LENGTH=174 /DNA_ID=CAMNT_0013297383 /DNA_START=77 /DNA_END=598 /DNA_ORIENTATION=+
MKSSNMFCTLAKEITSEILSYLEIKDIANFRATSEYYYYEFKLSYTEMHCREISNHLEEAYSRGGLHVVKRLLQDDSRVDPSFQDNRFIIWASESGYLCLVAELLKDSRVDPSAQCNRAIWYASQKGHTDVVQELLNNSSVDPSAKNNLSFCGASLNGHTDVIRVLLKDSRVDP